MNRSYLVLAVSLAWPVTAVAQAADAPMQVHYTGNLDIGDSILIIGNASDRNLCVNMYAFSPDEELLACCTCTVTPNGLKNVSVRDEVGPIVLMPGDAAPVVMKLFATTGKAVCNPADPGTPSTGLVAWATVAHRASGGGVALTESTFLPVTPGAGDIARISAVCGFLQANGSGYGVCRGCRPGAAGAARKN